MPTTVAHNLDQRCTLWRPSERSDAGGWSRIVAVGFACIGLHPSHRFSPHIDAVAAVNEPIDDGIGHGGVGDGGVPVLEGKLSRVKEFTRGCVS